MLASGKKGPGEWTEAEGRGHSWTLFGQSANRQIKGNQFRDLGIMFNLTKVSVLRFFSYK